MVGKVLGLAHRVLRIRVLAGGEGEEGSDGGGGWCAGAASVGGGCGGGAHVMGGASWDGCGGGAWWGGCCCGCEGCPAGFGGAGLAEVFDSAGFAEDVFGAAGAGDVEVVADWVVVRGRGVEFAYGGGVEEADEEGVGEEADASEDGFVFVEVGDVAVFGFDGAVEGWDVEEGVEEGAGGVCVCRGGCGGRFGRCGG